MALYETPSRIWRRIQDEREPSSLPSLPAFEHSMAPETESDRTSTDEDDDIAPVHSTPLPPSSHTVTSTIRLQSSTSSTARFASSITSRSASAKSSASRTYGRAVQDSFDISAITSLPHETDENTDSEPAPLVESTNSAPEAYLPPIETDEAEDMSLVDALESVSRSSSPFPPEPPQEGPTPKKGYDYSISLRSEPQPSPFEKFRNVALRRKPLARTRTPSLSRTTPSPVSSPPNSTPRSGRSIPLPQDTPSPIAGVHIPLPRSASASPAVTPLPSVIIQPPEEASQSSQEEQNLASNKYDDQQESEPDKASETDDGTPADREPTFSSASSDPSHPINRTIQVGRSPLAPSTAFPSPVPSTAFTPTPTIVPRPRPRFNIPNPARDLDVQEEAEDDSEPVTPNTRRRSFLLSVINSTARPRMKAPTPHPHRRISALPMHGGDAGDGQATPGVPLRKTFAGVTPRPGRGRLSHPLARTHVANGEVSPSEAGDGNMASPYDSANERASFISTASSHDLTTHPRANTSYDPAMGLGERGKMGRFDAQKLNTYLHGLNRRLQEENVALVARLQKYEEVKAGPRLSIEIAGQGRRLSAGSALGDVEEETGAEYWAEEKLEMEAVVQKMTEEVDQLTAEKELIEKELESERNGRARDKERWRERMQAVEKGVAEIVGELERKAEEAEDGRAEAIEEMHKLNREADRVRERLETERDLAVARARQAEQALESGKELGGALKEANSKVSALAGELQEANANIRELEEQALTSDRRVNELEKELKEGKLSAKLAEEDIHSQLNEMGAEIMRASARVTELENELAERDLALGQFGGELQVKTDELSELQRCIALGDQKAAEELRTLKGYAAELEEASAERVKALEDQLATAQDRVNQYEADEEQVNERMDTLEKEAERAAELARQMEEALEAAEEKMNTDAEMLANLRTKVVALEREQEKQRDLSISDQPNNHELEEALEAELDEANKEIARLNTLLQQSPARRAVEKAKDARIEMLEREKEDLLERVKSLRITNAEMATPGRVANISGISPIHRHVLSQSLRAPKTPGGPLKDLSWLNNTVADPTVSPLLAEIVRLQTELDRANESIDKKLDDLEDAGLGVVVLTKNLEDARAQIAASENEIARLERREERRLCRLEKLRCQKCLVKIDIAKLHRAYDADESSMDISYSGLPSNPPTPPTKTSDALRLDLQTVNAQLDAMKKQWQDEKRQLLGEKAVLQDAANRMNMEIQNAKEEARKATAAERANRRSGPDTHGEVEKAKAVIADLEAELHAERVRLRQMSTEYERLQRETGDVARQLQRTEADMDDVKRHLQKAKQENHELENELRVNTNAEQKARVLEGKVFANTETIDQLRQERSLLARDHKDLQRRFAEVSERANQLRSEYAVSQNAHEKRRQQLDVHLAEIDELRRALSNQADELQRTEQEKNRALIEKSDIARTIAELEADLKRVRKDAETFGRDLKALRAEKERTQDKQKEEAAKAERAKKQTETQIRLLNEQLQSQKDKAKKAKEELQHHVCSADKRQLEELKLQHKRECKGLVVQIRYLKAKFTRESTLRDDLSYQKQYLLVLLSGFEAR
ncbi:hypothetical protein F5I97DRAFT_1839637 [Phlebopus sp. FC_14]|nr:hypothetical protein F5I97DRAFT_1839637 [Phlebopus sp. FC_14]